MTPPPAKPDTPRGYGRKTAPERVWIYGRHPVLAALRNPARRCRRLVATKNAADWLTEQGWTEKAADDLKPGAIDALLPQGAVHQGLAGEFTDLPRARLKDACDAAAGRPVLVLDQVTDPQNVGALIRVAAAFGAQAVVVQDRRTPPVSGALAKAAAGLAETVPLVRVVNIARSLEALKEAGFVATGLAGEGAAALPAYAPTRPVALVVGAEGPGLRQLVRETCDELVAIPMAAGVESLNVSTAAAVALYALTAGQG
ncbi:TrmH family RNA methyltransferase [Parvularcula dongshanensis]|uniref:23S rRNA (Guanosine2251-2'-O)-methyltransferase n=1 Tax=Parvularcula dongshanensis TaxID=1173995 RepID=A0A840I2I1_9PROT|nr:RNA methyltransferase [Parvularcula dongshanensis]MBB4658491.1 23S rRNA (guanosine2251-2'-O)-methyltransferase [Parvularcula dongshanensis]